MTLSTNSHKSRSEPDRYAATQMAQLCADIKAQLAVFYAVFRDPGMLNAVGDWLPTLHNQRTNCSRRVGTTNAYNHRIAI